jgi:hypothetical protein
MRVPLEDMSLSLSVTGGDAGDSSIGEEFSSGFSSLSVVVPSIFNCPFFVGSGLFVNMSDNTSIVLPYMLPLITHNGTYHSHLVC